MCNSWNHDPDCQCGFGPPYSDLVEFGDVSTWAEEIMREPWLLRSGLKELGWDDNSIDDFERAAKAITGSGVPESTMVDRIREMLGRRQLIEEEVWEETVDVPLFRFGAPPVKAATVSYLEGRSKGDEVGWLVRVFGIGTGDTHELRVTYDRTYVASNGQCKQVLVPVTLRVARVKVFEDHKLVGRGVHAEVAAAPDTPHFDLRGRACVSVPKGHCQYCPEGERHHDVVSLRAAGDSTNDVHVFQKRWEMDIAREVSMRLKRVAEVGPLVRVKRVRRMELVFTLPAGYDYHGYLARSALWWSSPRPRSQPRRPRKR